MNAEAFAEWPARELERLVATFVATSPENSMKTVPEEPAWDEPLVGFASGADPIFETYKEHVGPFAFTPEELFALSFPEEPVRAEELTVMAWILPQRTATKEDNRRERLRGAERWARSRLYGERFNVLLREHVVASLAEVGISAVAPQLSPHWKERSLPSTADPRGGPNGTPPTPAAWEPSASATGSSPPKERRTGSVRWCCTGPCLPRRVPMPIIGPGVSSTWTEAVPPAFVAVPPGPFPKRGTTRSAVIVISKRFAFPTPERSGASKPTGAGSVRRAFPARAAFPRGSFSEEGVRVRKRRGRSVRNAPRRYGCVSPPAVLTVGAAPCRRKRPFPQAPQGRSTLRGRSREGRAPARPVPPGG